VRVDDRKFPALGEELPSFVSRQGLSTRVSKPFFSPRPWLLFGSRPIGYCDWLVLIPPLQCNGGGDGQLEPDMPRVFEGVPTGYSIRTWEEE